MKAVKLYTRQHENSLYELEKKGRITNKQIYVRLHMGLDAEYFIDRYKTFVDIAQEKFPKPEDVEFPIWCAVSKRSCLRPVEKEVIYCLEVPEDKVIYFDGLKWDYVLNYLYIPKDEADKDAYQKEIKRLQVTDEFNFIRGKYQGQYPLIENKIKDSWKRIFEIDDWNDFSVQGNIWEIRKEWVKKIVNPGEELD